MKKLTAGIFTVMLGLVAVDANAAITSQKYVDDKFTATTTELTTAIATAKSEATSAAATDATTKANQALADAKTYTDELKNGQVATNASNITSLTSSKQDKMVAGAGVVIAADGKTISAKAGEGITVTADGGIAVDSTKIATSEGLTELSNTVAGHTTAISNLQAEDTTINAKIGTVAEGSNLAKMISDEVTRADTAEKALGTRIDGVVATAGAALPKADFDTFKTANDTALAGKQDKLTADNLKGKNITVDIAENGTITLTGQNYELSAANGDTLGGVKTGGDVSITNGAITVDNNAITTDKINAKAVTAAKIADNTITTAQLATDVTGSLSKADTALQAESVNALAKAVTLPAACAEGGTGECVLKLKNGVYSWEDITRADGE